METLKTSNWRGIFNNLLVIGVVIIVQRSGDEHLSTG
jgi:hypothetical protein